ncbi:hypothetical protein B0H34DRAFT_690031 [Crassisporium funariophilum]|nr:hypothetical protein B0H34DRAFT_690031 [Crassisporium funariophilum]
MSSNHSLPRRTHRKRISALRLSSDTTSTLPEYLPAGWQHQSTLQEENVPLDKPPDYPDSAEEADEDTDTDSNIVYLPQPPPLSRPQTASPRRSKRFLQTHKRRHSSQFSPQLESNDPHLDALLARSVHALEMSNTLLQSSISTNSSLTAILALDSPADYTLEARARGLSSRMNDTWDIQATWADDLEEISRNVEGLFGQDIDSSRHSRRHSARSDHSMEGSVSCSLPSSSSLSMRRNRRRPSLDLREASDNTIAAGSPRLHYSQQSRSHLISPPPRALTQYIASTQDSDSIHLPSTLGLRSPPSIHPNHHPYPHSATFSDIASSSTTSLLSTPSLPPKLTDKALEPSTPAYTMLSSFVYRAPSSSGSATPSNSFTTSMLSRRRGSSTASTSTERTNTRRRSSPSPASHKSPDRFQHHHHPDHSHPGSGSTSASQTPSKRGVSPVAMAHRPMTPPVEESSSSSSSDGCVAKQTVQSLRKILSDQPAPVQVSRASSMNSQQRLRAPAFLPRTPAPVAEAGTSTATASISRLFTKGTHSSSTRAPEPPLQSAMKRSSSSSTSVPPSPSSPVPSTPTFSTVPIPRTLSIPDMVVKVLGGSIPSSGQSTPSKRISFAQLPESYASTRPGGVTSKFKDKQSRRKRKANGVSSTSSGKGGKGKGKEGEEDGWWNGYGWLSTGGSSSHGLSLSLARQEQRMEDRTTRNWGGRMGGGFGSGMDEWAV